MNIFVTKWFAKHTDFLEGWVYLSKFATVVIGLYGLVDHFNMRSALNVFPCQCHMVC